MSCCPVAVQLSIQLVILAIHVYSFRVEVDGIREFFFTIFIIPFVLVNLCYC